MTRSTGRKQVAAIVKKMDEQGWPNDGVDMPDGHYLPVLTDLKPQPPKPPQPKKKRLKKEPVEKKIGGLYTPRLDFSGE